MKRILSLLTVLAAMAAVMVCLTVTGFAAREYQTIINDGADCLTAEEEKELYPLLEKAADRAGINIAVVTKDDFSDTTPGTYARQTLNALFGGESDSIVLLIQADFDNENAYDYIEMSGKAYSKYYTWLDEIFDAYYAGKASGGYAGGVKGFCGFFTGGYDPAGCKALISDLDGVLEDSELVYLLSVMQDTADEIECNVGVVITSDRGGLTPQKYADNFADENFGYGSDNIVLLFDNDRVSPDHKDWISAMGLATEKYGGRIDSILDYMYVGFDLDGGDNYYQGIQYFCTYLRSYKESSWDYNHGEDYYYDYDDYDESDGIIMFAAPDIIALILAVVITSCVVKGYSKKAPISAARYMDSSRTKFTQRSDIYLRETTTRVRISSSSGGGGGHGGGGGRSGGGRSGGGGRSR